MHRYIYVGLVVLIFASAIGGFGQGFQGGEAFWNEARLAAPEGHQFLPDLRFQTAQPPHELRVDVGGVDGVADLARAAQDAEQGVVILH